MQQSIVHLAGIAPIRLDNGLFLDGEAEKDVKGNYIRDTQQGWEQCYVGTEKRFPTIGELVAGLRQSEQRKDSAALQGILQDLKEDWLCAGKIDYDKSNLPVGNGYLDKLVKDSAWRRALEDELFKDDAPETIEMLQRVSGKRPYIWTPNASGRKSHPERAVWLLIVADWFLLDCSDGPISLSGRARGVRGSEATGASVSEQEAPKGTMTEIKLLTAPAIAQSAYQPEQQPIYNTTELEYAQRLLNGAPAGTVLDWKKR